MTKPFSVLEDQVREVYGRVIYTHKCHEKMADQLKKKFDRFKWWEIALGAFTTSGILASFGFDEWYVKAVTALISFAAVWVTTMSKGYDLGGEIQKHRDAASKIWPIRESYLSLLTDLRSSAISDDDARKRRDALLKQLASIYGGVPQTNDVAYKAAQKALNQDEDLTFSKEELNRFLPESLRKP